MALSSSVTMPAIHLIHRQNDPRCEPIRRIAGTTDEYTTGFWLVSEKNANKLVGGKIYFHHKQAEKSYFGGIILDADLIGSGPEPRRVMFRFRFEVKCRYVRTPAVGWGQEMKLIWHP